MSSISYSYKRGIVTVTADDGTVQEWPLKTFEADPASCVAQTGNGITPPEPVLSTDEKIAQLEKRNAALEAALIEKSVVTKADIDVKVAIAVDAVALEVAVKG